MEDSTAWLSPVTDSTNKIDSKEISPAAADRLADPTT